MQIKEILESIINGVSLEKPQAKELMLAIMSGEFDETQIAALLVALRAKGETVPEICGFVEAMRASMNTLNLDCEAIDLCGTGGDNSDTFNISTTAAFVAAGAGLKVAKHGNRSISSKSGSADVLQALGVTVDLQPDQIKENIQHLGLGFIFAPLFHPAMKFVMPARKTLGIRTVFNLLGPLCNPCRVKRQVVGVYSKQWVVPLAEVLAELGAEHIIVVHGLNGMDEFSLSHPSLMAEWHQNKMNVKEFDPQSIDLQLTEMSQIKGAGPDQNAVITQSILHGEKGPRRDIVILNAAAAIRTGLDTSWEDSIQLAAQAIDEGAALNVLELLRGN